MSGRKAREERQRMAEQEKQMEELLSFDPYTAPDGDYYACSASQEHREDCDKDRCFVIDKWEVGVHIEKMRWQKEGLRLEQVALDVQAIGNHLDTLSKMVLEHIGMSQDDFDVLFRKQVYDNLVKNRAEFGPAVRARRNSELIARAIPPIFGANGRPIGQG